VEEQLHAFLTEALLGLDPRHKDRLTCWSLPYPGLERLNVGARWGGYPPPPRDRDPVPAA
jgi:hypothetical protein